MRLNVWLDWDFEEIATTTKRNDFGWLYFANVALAIKNVGQDSRDGLGENAPLLLVVQGDVVADVDLWCSSDGVHNRKEYASVLYNGQGYFYGSTSCSSHQ